YVDDFDRMERRESCRSDRCSVAQHAEYVGAAAARDPIPIAEVAEIGRDDIAAARPGENILAGGGRRTRRAVVFLAGHRRPRRRIFGKGFGRFEARSWERRSRYGVAQNFRRWRSMMQAHAQS